MKDHLLQGTILKGKKEYKIEKVLGNGGFGITYLATSTFMDGNIRRQLHYTIKEFFMSSLCTRDERGAVLMQNNDSEVKLHMKSFEKEAEYLQALKHPNIVPVNEIFRANNTLYYVMEFLGNLSLTNYVKQQGGKLNEEQAIPIILSLAEALRALHDKNMNHLDVKPDNVMMVEGENGLFPVLIDFGLSKHYDRSGNMTVAFGTSGASHGYSPLEQYLGVEKFSPKLDIYALGATLFYLLTGEAPCKSSEVSDAYIIEHLPTSLSESVRQTVLKAMKKNAEERTATIVDFKSSLGGHSINSGPANIDSNETIVINGGRKPKPQSSFNFKALLKPIVAAIIVLAIGGIAYFAMQYKPKELSAENKQEQTVNDSIKQESDTIVDPPIQDSNQDSIHDPIPVPIPPKPIIEYAKWDGEFVNGKADGPGTMRFTKSHDIGNGRVAEPGDYIVGSYDKGVLEHGKWYSADGTLKETIIQ